MRTLLFFALLLAVALARYLPQSHSSYPRAHPEDLPIPVVFADPAAAVVGLVKAHVQAELNLDAQGILAVWNNASTTVFNESNVYRDWNGNPIYDGATLLQTAFLFNGYSEMEAVAPYIFLDYDTGCSLASESLYVTQAESGPFAIPLFADYLENVEVVRRTRTAAIHKVSSQEPWKIVVEEECGVFRATRDSQGNPKLSKLRALDTVFPLPESLWAQVYAQPTNRQMCNAVTQLFNLRLSQKDITAGIDNACGYAKL